MNTTDPKNKQKLYRKTPKIILKPFTSQSPDPMSILNSN